MHFLSLEKCQLLFSFFFYTIANFHIPREEDGVFDEINFSEIYGPASDKIVRQYKDDALGLPTPYIPSKRPRYESKGRNYSSPRPKPSPYGYGAYGSSS